MVECHPVRDAPAAVMAGDFEAFVAELLHRGDQIGGQRPLAVRGVILGDRGPEGVPVAGQIRGDHREALGQCGRDGVPHQVRLGVAVQQEQRRAFAADAGVHGAAGGVEAGGGEALEEHAGGH